MKTSKKVSDKNQIINLSNTQEMKSTKTMVRFIGEIEVHQRTDNKMFNATALLNKWNESNPNDQRSMENFWKSTHLPELMDEIAKEEFNFTSVNSTDVEINSNTVDFTELKPKSTSRKNRDVKEDSNSRKFRELKKLLTKTGKARSDRGGGTWMHPMLFIKFAMYLNPRFEYQVLKFVQDNLIELRHEAGDKCNEMKEVLGHLVTDPANQYKELMKALNFVVFNKHEKDLRQTATTEQLKELAELESFIRNIIQLKLVTSWDKLIETLRCKFAEKYFTKKIARN